MVVVSREEVKPFPLPPLPSLWGVLDVFAHHRDGTDSFSCSLQPHLHSYKEAFEEMEGASPTSPPSSGGEISPPTPAFPVSPQTPYSNTCKCHASGRQRGSVGGSGQARNLPRVRQLQVPDTHHHVNHSSSPSSFLLHILPLHAAISIPPNSASHARHPHLGFFPLSTHWGVLSMGSQGGMRREACYDPNPSCVSPFFLLAWHEEKQNCSGRQVGGRQEGLKIRRPDSHHATSCSQFHRQEGQKAGAHALCMQLVSAPPAQRLCSDLPCLSHGGFVWTGFV